MKIALFGKRRQSEEDASYIKALVDKLSDEGIFTAIDRNFFEAMSRITGEALPVDDIFEGDEFSADFCFSIGGDGTFLRTARRVAEKEIPIAGFNTGHLGFLAEHSIADAPATVDMLLKGDYMVESRSLIEGKGVGGKVKEGISGWGYALNEIAILRQDTASMITVHATLDGMDIASYQGDGLIISTPTGSTAYNLSVGGPIVQPTAPCLVLSPIAPHSLTMRPLVVADNHEIRISVESRANTYRVTLDGRTLILPIDVDLRIRKAPYAIKIVHDKNHTFADTLRSKLLWGISKRNE